MSGKENTQFHRYTKYLGRNARVDRERSHHGKMVPHGASTMSDDEFWGKVRETAAMLDAARAESKMWERDGRLHV